MNSKLKILFLLLVMLQFGSPTKAAETVHHTQSDSITSQAIDVKGLILEHLADSYGWHVTTINGNPISVPLPIILYSQQSGFHCFSSSRFHHGHSTYKGFEIAQSGDFKGKIVEQDKAGNQIRPYDFSITKNAFALIFSSILLIIIILAVARSYKQNPLKSKKGFVGAMEMFIMSINDDVIKPSIGKDYAKFSPYLLTVFFFIFTNNLLGLIPLFPGGANVTGNIAVTMVLAVITFLIVNFSGTKEYYKEIFWPEVPAWLKVPIPLIPMIEIVGVFTKPFALMIRLFANIMAGHSMVLGLVMLIFSTVKLGTTINTSMTVVSVIFTIFISFVELLVAYIQAYVFTMLSAVFIGLARVEPHHAKKTQK